MVERALENGGKVKRVVGAGVGLGVVGVVYGLPSKPNPPKPNSSTPCSSS